MRVTARWSERFPMARPGEVEAQDLSRRQHVVGPRSEVDDAGARQDEEASAAAVEHRGRATPVRIEVVVVAGPVAEVVRGLIDEEPRWVAGRGMDGGARGDERDEARTHGHDRSARGHPPFPHVAQHSHIGSLAHGPPGRTPFVGGERGRAPARPRTSTQEPSDNRGELRSGVLVAMALLGAFDAEAQALPAPQQRNRQPVRWPTVHSPTAGRSIPNSGPTGPHGPPKCASPGAMGAAT